MRVRDVSHHQWRNFFDDFSHLFAGKHVNVESIEAELFGTTRRVRDQPLASITVAHGAADKDEWIEVIAGSASEDQSAHCIAHPVTVVVAEEENGQPVALQIESEGGEITVLRFEPSRQNLPEGFTIA